MEKELLEICGNCTQYKFHEGYYKNGGCTRINLRHTRSPLHPSCENYIQKQN